MPNLFWHYNPPPCKHTKSSLGHKFQVDLARYSLGQSCGRFTWAQSSASSNPKSRPSLSLSLSRVSLRHSKPKSGAVQCVAVGRTRRTPFWILCRLECYRVLLCLLPSSSLVLEPVLWKIWCDSQEVSEGGGACRGYLHSFSNLWMNSLISIDRLRLLNVGEILKGGMLSVYGAP